MWGLTPALNISIRQNVAFRKCGSCASASARYTLVERDYFDIVLALGVLHHLDDNEALTLFQIAHDAMKPGGRLVTIDGVWTDDQSHIVKYLLSRDRGRFVRSEAGYQGIGGKSVLQY